MAGEIGHIRLTESGPTGYGKAGSMEGYCSGGGIEQIGECMVTQNNNDYLSSRLYELTKNSAKISAKDIADLADDEDELCGSIYRTSGEKLGQGLGILIDILNPEIIIIGSIFTRSQHLLWDSAKKEIEKEALARNWSVCKVVASELGDEVGDYAALTVATGNY